MVSVLVAIGLGGCGVPKLTEPPAIQATAATRTALETKDASPEPTSEATPTATREPATGEPEEPAYIPVFEAAECQVKVQATYERDCGYLVVPEDRSQPDSPTVRLPVAIFKSASSEPAPDPVFHLVGGPGGNLLDGTNYYLEAGGDRILEARDYVLFNQRGTHYAEPSLECPGQDRFRWDLASQDLNQEERDAREIEFLMGCHDYLLEQGINLAAYDSAANAADVNDLRIALGYDQVNLYGISYGTRLALTVMRDHPEGFRSVILDSVYPPQVALNTDLAPNAERGFSTLFEGCAADAHCSERYPDLEAVFYQVAEDLNAEPVTVHLSNGGADVHLDGDFFLDLIFGSLYRADAIPWIPLMIYQASQGNYDPLHVPLQVALDESGISLGMHYGLQCREEVAFELYDEALARASALPPQVARRFASPFLFTLCESWRSGRADPVENEAVVSRIPTLILSGQYDPVTPPAWGRLAGETLSNSLFYEFPAVGHGVIRSNECGLEIAVEFLDDPTAAPDASCIEELGGPDFR